jgi:hypothetical protein
MSFWEKIIQGSAIDVRGNILGPQREKKQFKYGMD